MHVIPFLSVASTLTWMVDPIGENLIALPSRFAMTCSMRYLSPNTYT